MINSSKVLGDERMRYTRYDLKKKQGGNKYFIIVLSIILVVALSVGTAMSKLLLKNNGYLNGTSSNETNSTSSNNIAKNYEYVFLQGGFFSKRRCG